MTIIITLGKLHFIERVLEVLPDMLVFIPLAILIYIHFFIQPNARMFTNLYLWT